MYDLLNNQQMKELMALDNERILQDADEELSKNMVDFSEMPAKMPSAETDISESTMKDMQTVDTLHELGQEEEYSL